MKKIYKPVALLALLTVLAILFYNAYVLFNPEMKTQIVSKGTIEEKIETEAMIIREESILLKASDVIASSGLVDGERVAKGEKVADLYYGETSPAVQAELRSVNEKILSIETLMEHSGYGAGHSPDTIMSGYAQKIMKAAHVGAADELFKARDSIEDAVNRKIASDISGAETVLDTLRDRRTELEKNIIGDKKELYADTSGVFFTAFDGYEDKVVLEEMEKLTPSSLAQIKKEKTESNAYDTTMKIADGYMWRLAVTVSEDKLPSIKKGADLGIRFPRYGEDVYTVEVTHISDVEDGKALVICLGTTYNEPVYYNRFMDAELILSSYSGLKFFKDAVKMEDNKTGVYVVKSDGTAQFKEIEVLASDDAYTVVKDKSDFSQPLKIYDEVIITDSPIQNGDVVHR